MSAQLVLDAKATVLTQGLFNGARGKKAGLHILVEVGIRADTSRVSHTFAGRTRQLTENARQLFRR